MAPQLHPELLALLAGTSGDALRAWLLAVLVAVAMGAVLGTWLRLGAEQAGGPQRGLRDAASALGSTALLVLVAAVLPYLRWRSGGPHAPVAAHIAPLALVGAGWVARGVEQALYAAAVDRPGIGVPHRAGPAVSRLPLRAATTRLAAVGVVAMVALALCAGIALAVGRGAAMQGGTSVAPHGLPDALLGVVLLLIAVNQAVHAAGDWAVLASGRVGGMPGKVSPTARP